MDFQAKVIQFIGETTGVSKAGNPWKKKEWLVETFGQFPRKVRIQCFGDKSDQLNLEPGHDYNIYVDLESREFNGRWYTDVSVYRAEELNGQPAQMGQPQGPYTQPQQNFGGNNYGNPGNSFGAAPTPDFTSNSVGESDEDLPF